MSLDPNLPNLTSIGNRYRERTRTVKNKKLSVKYKARVELDSSRSIYREAILTVLSRLQSYEGMLRKDARDAVTTFVWEADYPHDKLAFNNALKYLIAKNKVMVKEINGEKVYRLK